MHTQNMKCSLVSLFCLLFITGCTEQLPGEERAKPPNILFAIADDVSFPHMGVYGTDWVKTPAFDRVAREGLLFSRAYTPNAKCAPSRSIILTGRNSWQLEEAANHWPYFPQAYKTFFEVLSEGGYHVGYTAKGWAPGIALDAEGDRRNLTGRAYNEFQLEPPAEHISGNDYAKNFEAFLDEHDSEKPFVFWYGSLEPHRAYEFRAGVDKGGKSLNEIDEVPAFWPDVDSVRIDMLDYAYEIEHFDAHLMRMLSLLEERGELENTLVIVTADNGMPFPRAKGQSYEYSNHLPLAMMWPDGIQNSGRIIEDFVSFADFAPTIMDLYNLDPVPNGMQPVEGKSMVPVLVDAADKPHREHILIGKERHDIGRPGDAGYPMRGIVKGDYLFIRNFEVDRWPSGNPITGYLNCDGSPTKSVCLNARTESEMYEFWNMSFGQRPAEELYNIVDDPECVNNLAGIDDYQSVKSSMEEEMIARLLAQEDPRILGNGEVFDEYEYADTRHVNFYEKYISGEALNAGWVNPSDFEEIPEEK